MDVVYAGEELPEEIYSSIFLAGPTQRDPSVPSWRKRALQILTNSDYQGTVFVPESRESGSTPLEFDDEAYRKNVEWEEQALNVADCIAFWVPRDLETLPGFTTNVEWGVWCNSGKVLFGAPVGARKIRYLQYYADKNHVPSFQTLESLLLNASGELGSGRLRIGGERFVPLCIWHTDSFWFWYRSQQQAGNELRSACVVWTFRPGTILPFFWALHVDMFVKAENRYKTNEIVLSRPDISTALLYKRRTCFEDTQVALVREFRSPARTFDGFVRELPGGSAFLTKGSAWSHIRDECKQELGLTLSGDRFHFSGSRQLAATLSTHYAHVWSVELTDKEFEYLQSIAGQPQGVEEDTERTYVEIWSVKDLLATDYTGIDWSMIGMILSVLHEVIPK